MLFLFTEEVYTFNCMLLQRLWESVFGDLQKELSLFRHIQVNFL